MNVGFIGLGDTGQAIVPRLLAAGRQVTGRNRSKEKGQPLGAIGELHEVAYWKCGAYSSCGNCFLKGLKPCG